MKYSKDFTALDELFRETFEALPDTPSPSGWDEPSPRIWENIQAHLQAPSAPPRRRFSSTWIYVGAAVVALSVGLYWALLPSTPSTKGDILAEAPSQATEVVVDKRSADHSPARAVIPGPPAVPKASKVVRKPFVPSTETISQPLQEGVPAPNTTIRRQVEEYRRCATPPLLPLPPRNPALRSGPPDVRPLLLREGNLKD